ncbi:MAG TPA: Gfo/Idh/MocA family oxidoreductase [Solirubrobacteraceae bacterium]|jgi:predicted dehydrogenase|nr:Gfo/Idh/MocA family oxidoreductase [Solirubrobacteraceae bacterium]
MTNWGFLSTARINDALLGGIAAVPEEVAYAIASRDAGRAAEYARLKGIERSYGSYQELLADPDVDIVYVSLPNGLHVEWTRRALEAGKHVLCEKPLSRSPSEVEELFELAQTRGRQLSEAFMYRHNPQTKLIKELVDAGAIGDLRLIRGSFSFNCDPADPRMLVGMEGGGLMDVGCYPVNMARLLAGEPERVSAQQLLGGDGVDVVMAGVLCFPGGVIGQFDCGLAMPDRHGLEVVGATGALLVAWPWNPIDHRIELWEEGAEEPRIITVPAADSYALQVADLSAASRGEHLPLLGRTDALGQARTLEALYASAESGQSVTL